MGVMFGCDHHWGIKRLTTIKRVYNDAYLSISRFTGIVVKKVYAINNKKSPFFIRCHIVLSEFNDYQAVVGFINP